MTLTMHWVPYGFQEANHCSAAKMSVLSLQVIGDQAIYENELVASRDVKTGSLGSVTRDSTFR